MDPVSCCPGNQYVAVTPVVGCVMGVSLLAHLAVALRRCSLRRLPGHGFSHRVRNELSSGLWENPLRGGGAQVGGRGGLEGMALHYQRRTCGVVAGLAGEGGPPGEGGVLFAIQVSGT